MSDSKKEKGVLNFREELEHHPSFEPRNSDAGSLFDHVQLFKKEAT